MDHMPEASTASPARASTAKPQRVLACVLCQRRKVKCDRRYPCANCIKAQAQCVPATLVKRRRRRKFPEQELVARLQTYEELLRKNNIEFQPLLRDELGGKGASVVVDARDTDDDNLDTTVKDYPSPSNTVKSDTVYEAKSLWHALNQLSRDHGSDSDSSHDEFDGAMITTAWDDMFGEDDNLLFGMRKAAVQLSTLHPQPAQIFRLWQIYLDNVDPLLKVTHTPSLQGRIAEAASNVAAIAPDLEALMFGIYCTAIFSLTFEESQAIFGSPQQDLLSSYQFGCQQALLNSGFLRSESRDCLTALFLYLISVRISTVPRALSSMLGLAIRIAERMGIHSEAELAKFSPLEAEMRRRLWWALVLFDTRIGEMSDYKAAKLVPMWDCRVPSNVNDSDLRAEMRELPEPLAKPCEAIFAVLRAELGDFVRNCMFYLDFTAPALKPIARDVHRGHPAGDSELYMLESMIEGHHLRSCDPENSLHLMAMWTTRGALAKYRLVEYHSKSSESGSEQTDVQRDTAISIALKMLECDTKLMTSLITRKFLWQLNFQFPFPGYIHIIQDLRRRPGCELADRAWEAMNENYQARFGKYEGKEGPFFKIFGRIVLQAWQIREAFLRQAGQLVVTPAFVVSIKEVLARIFPSSQSGPHDGPKAGSEMDLEDLLGPMDFGNSAYGFSGSEVGVTTGADNFSQMSNQVPLDFDMGLMNWSGNSWSFAGMPFPSAQTQGAFGMNMPGAGPGGGNFANTWPT